MSEKKCLQTFCVSRVIVSYFQLVFSNVKEKNSCWLWLPFGNNQRRQLEVVAFYLGVQIWPLSLLWPSVLFLFKDCFKLLFKPFTRHFFVLLNSIFVRLGVSFDVVKRLLLILGCREMFLKFYYIISFSSWYYYTWFLTFSLLIIFFNFLFRICSWFSNIKLSFCFNRLLYISMRSCIYFYFIKR